MTNMKLSKQTINDLLVLIQHTRSDISYGEGGTYSTPDLQGEIDHKAVKQAERAIEFIKQLIILRD